MPAALAAAGLGRAASPNRRHYRCRRGDSIFCFESGPGALGNRRLGEDPSRFVLDEAAGICLTILFLPAHAGWMPNGITLLAAFVAFRVFDITKIPPARQLENLPGGWGILLDDLAAAVYANIVCQVLLRWIISAT